MARHMLRAQVLVCPAHQERFVYRRGRQLLRHVLQAAIAHPATPHPHSALQGLTMARNMLPAQARVFPVHLERFVFFRGKQLLRLAVLALQAASVQAAVCPVPNKVPPAVTAPLAA